MALAYIRILRGGGGLHPDQGLPGGGGGEHPDQGLPPGEVPVDPAYGISIEHPDQGLPAPPVGVWPPPSGSRPIVPIGPDNTLPVAPGTIWPNPGRPPRPDHSLPGGQGGEINNGLPSQTYWMIAYCPSLGWRYIAVDPSLVAGMPLPPHAEPR